MRTNLARILLLVVTACVLAGAENSAPMELVIGTWREGSNFTDPRPAQSQYFKTTFGGFQLLQGFAGFKWFIEVIKHPVKRIYTRTLIENPQDPKSPFVYDGVIDPDTPSTTLTHGPVRGLKIKQDYTLVFTAYADEQRTFLLDRLTQKVRSYVDTTGPRAKLYEGMKSKATDSLTENPGAPAGEKKR